MWTVKYWIPERDADIQRLRKRLATMEAAVLAAKRIIRCYETGYLSDTPMDSQIASTLHTADLDALNTAAELLNGDHNESEARRC